MDSKRSENTFTAKPAEYQPVATVDANAHYPTVHTFPPSYSAGSNSTPLDYGPRPNNYIVLTVITLCLCMGWPALFCSIIAIIYSMQVDLAWDMGQKTGARQASMYAKRWANAAIFTGAVATIAIGLTLYGYLYAAPTYAATSGNTQYQHGHY